jgi:hypothetical protein
LQLVIDAIINILKFNHRNCHLLASKFKILLQKEFTTIDPNYFGFLSSLLSIYLLEKKQKYYPVKIDTLDLFEIFFNQIPAHPIQEDFYPLAHLIIELVERHDERNARRFSQIKIKHFESTPKRNIPSDYSDKDLSVDDK